MSNNLLSWMQVVSLGKADWPDVLVGAEVHGVDGADQGEVVVHAPRVVVGVVNYSVQMIFSVLSKCFSGQK